MLKIDPTIYHGRPEEPRSDVEERCYDLLQWLYIPYIRVEHEPADTIEECKEVETQLGCRICKNLFLANRRQTAFFLLVLPGDKPFKTKYLSNQIGSSRLSFAAPERMERMLGATPGSASVLGLMNDTENKVRLLVDRAIKDWQVFGCHPCRNTTSLCFPTDCLFSYILPAIYHEPEFVSLPWEVEE